MRHGSPHPNPVFRGPGACSGRAVCSVCAWDAACIEGRNLRRKITRNIPRMPVDHERACRGRQVRQHLPAAAQSADGQRESAWHSGCATGRLAHRAHPEIAVFAPRSAQVERRGSGETGPSGCDLGHARNPLTREQSQQLGLRVSTMRKLEIGERGFPGRMLTTGPLSGPGTSTKTAWPAYLSRAFGAVPISPRKGVSQ